MGSLGTASMTNPTLASTVASGTLAEHVPADWRERFGAAYTAELQAWISGLRRARCVGPSAWEGYAATSGRRGRRRGRAERCPDDIDYIPKPALYR